MRKKLKYIKKKMKVMIDEQKKITGTMDLQEYSNKETGMNEI